VQAGKLERTERDFGAETFSVERKGGGDSEPDRKVEGKVAGDVSMEDVAGGEESRDDDLRMGTKCTRCSKKGHSAARCMAELYCVICDDHDHLNHRCSILKQPRPVAHAIGYVVHGLGFYHIPHPPLSRKMKDTKVVLIKVVRGELNKKQVRSQLQRIFPSKWQWDLVVLEDGSFITKFPTKSKLQRAVAFGGADVKEGGISSGLRLQFEVCHEKEEVFFCFQRFG
jgi:hypothetical protein